MSEIGIQFNQNTSTTVDATHVRDAAQAIDGLITESGLDPGKQTVQK
jgi:hypothetical protein